MTKHSGLPYLLLIILAAAALFLLWGSSVEKHAPLGPPRPAGDLHGVTFRLQVDSGAVKDPLCGSLTADISAVFLRRGAATAPAGTTPDLAVEVLPAPPALTGGSQLEVRLNDRHGAPLLDGMYNDENTSAAAGDIEKVLKSYKP